VDEEFPVCPARADTAPLGRAETHQTAFRLLAAEEPAVDPGLVRVVQGDTDLCPFDAGTFGSGSMPMRESRFAARRNNIGYGKQGATDAEITAAADAACADHFVRTLPAATARCSTRTRPTFPPGRSSC